MAENKKYSNELFTMDINSIEWEVNWDYWNKKPMFSLEDDFNSSILDNDDLCIYSLEELQDQYYRALQTHNEIIINNAKSLIENYIKEYWDTGLINRDMIKVNLESIKPIKPTTSYINNTKLANQINNPKLQSNEDGQIHFKLNTGKSNSPKSIVSIIDIDFSKVILDRNITEYDKIVQNAIYTIYKSDSKFFTPQIVARIMAGDMNKKITPKKIRLVTESIKKLQKTFITIDMTDEMISRGMNIKEFKMEGYMLPITSTYVKMASNGKEIIAYKLLDKPLLYKYAEKLRQIITVPFELLNIEGTSDTEDSIIIKNYLLRRIELMKNDNNNVEGYNISYKTIYKLLNIKEENCASNSAWTTQTLNCRNTVKNILNYWKKVGYIQNYIEYIDSKNYKSMGGIKIDIVLIK